MTALALGESSDSAGGGRLGPASTAHHDAALLAPGLAAALAALAAGGRDQLLQLSILQHSMFLSLRKTGCFTLVRAYAVPMQQRIVYDDGNVMEVHWWRMSLYYIVAKDLPACNC